MFRDRPSGRRAFRIAAAWCGWMAVWGAGGFAVAGEPEAAAAPEDYGRSKERPVLVGEAGRAMSPLASRKYIRRLRDDQGRPYRFGRVGSVGVGAHAGHVVDVYRLVDPDGREARIFIDAYHPEIPYDAAPIVAGFGEGPAPDGDPADDRLADPLLPVTPLRSADGRYQMRIPAGWKPDAYEDARMAASMDAAGQPFRVAVWVRDLPEGGMAAALEDWLKSAKEQGREVKTHKENKQADGSVVYFAVVLREKDAEGNGNPAPAEAVLLRKGKGEAEDTYYEVVVASGPKAFGVMARLLGMMADTVRPAAAGDADP